MKRAAVGQARLALADDEPARQYDLDDVAETARDGLSYNGTFYALPFYVESSMTYYRKDLFQAAGLKMPTYDQIKQLADKLTDKSKGQ